MIKRLSILQNSFFSAFIYILLVAVLSIASVNQNGYSSLCAKGVAFLSESKADSALFYFSQAFRNGMPQDSFYYFWAESYLNKGSADSAFVINYSISLPADVSFKNKVLEQRYVIYSSLGWSDKANSVLDSITSNITVDKKGIWRLFLPSLNFRANGNMVTSKENQIDNPIPLKGDSSLLTGPGYQGQLGAQWTLPITKSIIFSPGIRYSIRNTGRECISKDSIGKNLSLSGDISFGSLFGISYTWRRSDAVQGQVDFMHDFSINKIISADKWDAMLFGDFSLSNSYNKDYSGKYGMFYAYFDRQLSNKNTIISSFIASAQWFKPVSLNYKIPIMYVDDVTKAPGAVVHYYKDSLSKPIPPDNPTQTLSDYKSNVDLLSLQQIIPSTSYNFSSQFSYQIPIIWKMNVSFSFEYSLLWYPQAFKWYQFYSNVSLDEWQYVYNSGLLWGAYNMKDKKFYFATEPEAGSGQIQDLFSAGPVYVDIEEKIRVDNSISFSLGLAKNMGRFGSLNLATKFWKNYSTLPKDAQVSIPDRGINVSLDYSINVSF
jgi:hypothetical protein